MNWSREFDEMCVREYGSVVGDTVFFEINEGWHSVVVKLLKGLKKLNETYKPYGVRIEEIKQKYCDLSVYWYVVDEGEFTMLEDSGRIELWNKAECLIKDIQAEAARTCELCGKECDDIVATQLNLCPECDKKWKGELHD